MDCGRHYDKDERFLKQSLTVTSSYHYRLVDTLASKFGSGLVVHRRRQRMLDAFIIIYANSIAETRFSHIDSTDTDVQTFNRWFSILLSKPVVPGADPPLKNPYECYCTHVIKTKTFAYEMISLKGLKSPKGVGLYSCTKWKSS